jgi:site-specific DNA-methyltransferase (adenine-specific)
MLELNTIIQGDCLEVMKEIDDKSIDMILCDLPYAETGNAWDCPIDPDNLWYEYKRILKNQGAIVLTGTFKFGVQLFNSCPELYKYDWVWEKDNGTNAPNVNYQPFRTHEQVFVFGKGRVSYGTALPMKYTPQKTAGKPYSQKSGKVSDNWKGGLKNCVTENITGDRHPKTIQKFNRDKERLHPTQKPVALFEYLIRTYTNAGDLVLDNCAGSFTTAIACMRTNRNWICIEQEQKYCDIGAKRIAEQKQNMGLFEK